MTIEAPAALPPARPPSSLAAALRVAYFATLIYALLSLGAVDPISRDIVGILLAAIGMLSLGVRSESRQTAALEALVLMLLLPLVAAAVLQSIRFDAHPFEHSVWTMAREQLGPMAGAVSVVAEESLSSVLTFSPALGLAIALRLFGNQREALRLLRNLSVLGATFAIFATLQLILFPNALMFGEKITYIGSLTAPFVNRNTAGTMMGLSTLVGLALSFFHLRSIDPRRFMQVMAAQTSWSRDYLWFLGYASCAFVSFIALMLTQSRGAIAATFIGVMVLVLILSTRRMTGLRSTKESSPRRRQLRLAAIWGITLSLFLLFAGKASQRMEEGGVDGARLCVYAATIQAARDNWPLGAGLGSFGSLFPAYRNSQCVGISGSWEAAHNSYLEGVLDLGLTFITCFSVALASFASVLVGGTRRRKRLRFAPTLGIAIVTILALHASVDFSLQIPGLALYVSAIAAACLSISLGGASA